MQIIVGPYELRDLGDLLAWMPPGNAIGALNLRSLANVTDAGIGLFAVPDKTAIDKGFTRLGASLEDQMDGAFIDHLAAYTGAKELAQGTLSDVLWQLFNIAANPTGETSVKPLMPENSGKVVLHFAGQVIGGERFNPADAKFAAALDQYREGYRLLRQESLDGKQPPDAYLKALDYWGDKFQIARPQDVFIPTDLPAEIPVKHATVLTETFTKSDGAGLGPDQTWSGITGSTATESNRAVPSGGIGAAKISAALSGADMYAQAQIYRKTGSHSGSDYIGPCVRVANAADTHYFAIHFNTNNGWTFLAAAGSYSGIGTNTTSLTWADGNLSYISASGSSIVRKYNGSTENTATDTTVDGVTVGSARGGVFGRVTSANYYMADNFEAGDLSAPPSGQPFAKRSGGVPRMSLIRGVW